MATIQLIVASCLLVVVVVLASSGTCQGDDDQVRSSLTGNAFDVTPAVNYSVVSSSSLVRYTDHVKNFTNGDYLGYLQLDFGAGAEGINMYFNTNANTTKAQIHFILDSPNGFPFHSTTVGYTTSYGLPITEFLDYSPTVKGIHDLYLKFQVDASGDALDVYWFQFYQ